MSTEQTKDDLMEEAKRLDIQGRSSMNKEELAAAIEQAQSQQPSEEDAGDHEAPTPSMTEAPSGGQQASEQEQAARAQDPSRQSPPVNDTREGTDGTVETGLQPNGSADADANGLEQTSGETLEP